MTGVTGMRIVRAIIAGERDPKRARGSPRRQVASSSVATIRDALTGNYRPSTVFALRQAVEL